MWRKERTELEYEYFKFTLMQVNKVVDSEIQMDIPKEKRNKLNCS
jgi:hypothetical protein